MYYMRINKNLVHQVGDQTKVILRCMVKARNILTRYEITASRPSRNKAGNVPSIPGLSYGAKESIAYSTPL